MRSPPEANSVTIRKRFSPLKTPINRQAYGYSASRRNSKQPMSTQGRSTSAAYARAKASWFSRAHVAGMSFTATRTPRAPPAPPPSSSSAPPAPPSAQRPHASRANNTRPWFRAASWIVPSIAKRPASHGRTFTALTKACSCSAPPPSVHAGGAPARALILGSTLAPSRIAAQSRPAALAPTSLLLVGLWLVASESLPALVERDEAPSLLSACTFSSSASAPPLAILSLASSSGPTAASRAMAPKRARARARARATTESHGRFVRWTRTPSARLRRAHARFALGS
mmetsp:Transcript_99604/g.304510  ORF Transcript_99604/g.304510 Transcript_99604/m.304510 type:complete len:285 (+) Transcript_99604:745-1599(+)